jgi:hypothetical protein
MRFIGQAMFEQGRGEQSKAGQGKENRLLLSLSSHGAEVPALCVGAAHTIDVLDLN